MDRGGVRGGGGVCSGVCLHQNHERDIFHCPDRAPSHFLPPQTAVNRQSQANKYLRKKGKVFLCKPVIQCVL